MGYDWNFAYLYPYATAFLLGTLITIELSVVSFVIGTIAGIPIGILLRVLPARHIFLIVNDAIRAIPLLVMLLFVYYFPYSQLLGVQPPSAFWCAVIAIAFIQAAYTADLVRAAVDGVPKRAILGARAIGLTEPLIYRYIVLPDVIRQILPAEVAFFIGIIRLSSLASVIGCEEVVFVARTAIAQSFRSLEAWVVVSLIYIVLVVPLTIVLRRLEGSRWLKRRA